MTTVAERAALGAIPVAFGACLIALAIAAGAVGSHWVQNQASHQLGTYRIAVHYHELTGFAFLLTGLLKGYLHRVAYIGLLAGFFIALILFCGLLYGKTLGLVGTTTSWVPVGGSLMILCWAALGIDLALSTWQRRKG